MVPLQHTMHVVHKNHVWMPDTSNITRKPTLGKRGLPTGGWVPSHNPTGLASTAHHGAFTAHGVHPRWSCARGAQKPRAWWRAPHVSNACTFSRLASTMAAAACTGACSTLLVHKIFRGDLPVAHTSETRHRSTPRAPSSSPRAHPELPQSSPKALPKLPQSSPKALPKLSQSSPKAAPKLPLRGAS